MLKIELYNISARLLSSRDCLCTIADVDVNANVVHGTRPSIGYFGKSRQPRHLFHRPVAGLCAGSAATARAAAIETAIALCCSDTHPHRMILTYEYFSLDHTESSLHPAALHAHRQYAQDTRSPDLRPRV